MVRWNVRAIWENYAGWFHHSSTTELYPVGVEEISRELVAIAGTDSLIGRARDLLAEGEPVKAIYLAEIVHRVQPHNDVARQVLIAAHENLLEASTNFWETAWLRNQIARLS